MSRRVVLGNEGSMGVGFWATKPGFDVWPGATADQYQIATHLGIGTPQIILLEAFALNPGNSIGFTFPFDVGHRPITFIYGGDGGFNSYSPLGNATIQAQSVATYAIVDQFGVVVVNPSQVPSQGIVCCINRGDNNG